MIAAIVEDLKYPASSNASPPPLQQENLLFVQVARSTTGQPLIARHRRARRQRRIMAAFLRPAASSRPTSGQFVETIALFANARLDRATGNDVVMVSGSGGGAALAADHRAAGLKLAELHAGQEKIKVRCRVGDVTNPIDVTGAVFTIRPS